MPLDTTSCIFTTPHLKSKEHLPTHIFADSDHASLAVATDIATLIKQRQHQGKTCVLGLATGSTYIHVYDQLVRMHKEEGLSFSNVVTFNLDEYYPMQPNALQSYHSFMHHYFFRHIDIPPANIHIPLGHLPKDQLRSHCTQYEQAIQAAGGIDLQLVGLGRDGHIGFNEPGSNPESTTRLVALGRGTRVDAASEFFGEDSVPRRALTMGIGTILQSKKIVLMAFGEGKSRAVAEAVEGVESPACPASYLQRKQKGVRRKGGTAPGTPSEEAEEGVVVVVDKAAAGDLTRVSCPWTLGVDDTEEWWKDEKKVKHAVLWLSDRVGRPVTSLEEDDYTEHGLQGLLDERGSAEDINASVLDQLQESIWDIRKERFRDEVESIQGPVVVFSPHPDDDVISMGGTLRKLVQEGGLEVHVAYQTNGNISVRDEDVRVFTRFTSEFVYNSGTAANITPTATAATAAAPHVVGEQTSGKSSEDFEALKKRVDTIHLLLDARKPGEPDAESVQHLKALIRKCEAESAARLCGVAAGNLHFLDMPFYQTGSVIKAPLTNADITVVETLLNKVKSGLIFAAGDMSDPHGTHRQCLQALLVALQRVVGSKDSPWWGAYPTGPPQVLLYRGAWQEWKPWDADVIVPMTAGELKQKIDAIFRHQSQKDRPLFPGSDPDREFWQRAAERNKACAAALNAYGIQEYVAAEAFVRYDLSMGTSLPWT